MARPACSPFEPLLKAYVRLSVTILYTIRLEVRLRVMHYLDKATRDGIYQLAEDSQEPDPSIVDLNGDLAEVDEVAAGTLENSERRFAITRHFTLQGRPLTTGLSPLGSSSLAFPSSWINSS